MVGRIAVVGGMFPLIEWTFRAIWSQRSAIFPPAREARVRQARWKEVAAGRDKSVEGFRRASTRCG